jgi:hypothetical protein
VSSADSADREVHVGEGLAARSVGDALGWPCPGRLVTISTRSLTRGQRRDRVADYPASSGPESERVGRGARRRAVTRQSLRHNRSASQPCGSGASVTGGRRSGCCSCSSGPWPRWSRPSGRARISGSGRLPPFRRCQCPAWASRSSASPSCTDSHRCRLCRARPRPHGRRRLPRRSSVAASRSSRTRTLKSRRARLPRPLSRRRRTRLQAPRSSATASVHRSRSRRRQARSCQLPPARPTQRRRRRTTVRP